jgi:3'-phosphoadenosine 5'-phosphosulfate sulfotransferase (PAPS reductase)/FAD synthetase
VVGVNDLKLRPVHYASVSGGKDSLFMLGLILSKPEKYPLDMVVNFDLEIEWDVAKTVVQMMEERCKNAGIRFVKIKPRKTWTELYKKNGFPNGWARARWCNKSYKLDCKKQLNKWIKQQNCRPVAYIGLCADEVKRFKYRVGEEDWRVQEVCYPLAEEGIEESTILSWAREQPIFKGYYDNLERMGCMACPMATMLEWAYFLQKEPEKYKEAIARIKETEVMVAEKGRTYKFKGLTAEQFDERIRNKWLRILEEKQKKKEKET